MKKKYKKPLLGHVSMRTMSMLCESAGMGGQQRNSDALGHGSDSDFGDDDF